MKINETMEVENHKSKALTKQETKALIDLIYDSKILNTKPCNAATNKLKADEWNRITEEFNANVSTYARTPQQLRLKWDNLKKTARKRNFRGPEQYDYVPPDEILDQVTAILDRSNTVDSLTEQFGGDAESRDGENDIITFTMEKGSLVEVTEESTESIDPLKPPHLNEMEVDISEAKTCFTIEEPKKTICKNSTPKAFGKKRKLRVDEGRTARNVAIAEYYTVKRKLLEAKLDKIILENDKLRMELEKIKQSI